MAELTDSTEASGERGPAGDSHTWAVPVPLGSRLLWRYEDRNWSIPNVKVESIYTDQRRLDLDNGWMAVLPTENGVEVSLSYDPQPDYPENERLSLHISVRHPEFDHRIDARIERFEVPGEGVRYWVEYDPDCMGDACVGPCSCTGLDHAWSEYVTSPQHILDRLAWLGSLPIKVSASGS